MSKYILEIDANFEKGECEKCPIYEAFQNYAFVCFAKPENCPLEEVKQGEWKKSYQSGMRVSNGFVSSCCDMWSERKLSHCPHCGKPMKGDE